jgi:hypothetical protein
MMTWCFYITNELKSLAENKAKAQGKSGAYKVTPQPRNKTSIYFFS